MDLKLKDQRFVICGASSGLGQATARQLLIEGANVVLVARRGDEMSTYFRHFTDQIEIIQGSVLESKTLESIESTIKRKKTHGILLNAGGPPTGSPLTTSMDDWDAAWQLVMRWKIDLCLKVAPLFRDQQYGRIIFIESQSVKQPLPVLALSNSFRAGVVGFAKSLALEVAKDGVTVNVIAPGSHDTPAIQRVIEYTSKIQTVTQEKARERMEASIPVGRMGKAEELASLASWLLSEHSSYITGQTISHDGGVITGLFG
jgi:3-oxoacyl-[acyl-carrier protein] reductase